MFPEGQYKFDEYDKFTVDFSVYLKPSPGEDRTCYFLIRSVKCRIDFRLKLTVTVILTVSLPCLLKAS